MSQRTTPQKFARRLQKEFDCKYTFALNFIREEWNSIYAEAKKLREKQFNEGTKDEDFETGFIQFLWQVTKKKFEEETEDAEEAVPGDGEVPQAVSGEGNRPAPGCGGPQVRTDE